MQKPEAARPGIRGIAPGPGEIVAKLTSVDTRGIRAQLHSAEAERILLAVAAMELSLETIGSGGWKGG
jgi:hypothetical protein